MPPTAADPLKLKAAPGHRAMEAFASVGGGGAGNPAIKFCFPGPTLIQLKKLKHHTVGGFQGMDRPRIPNAKFVGGKGAAAAWQMAEPAIACREAMGGLAMGHPGVKLPPHECMARCQDELRKLAALGQKLKNMRVAEPGDGWVEGEAGVFPAPSAIELQEFVLGMPAAKSMMIAKGRLAAGLPCECNVGVARRAAMIQRWVERLGVPPGASKRCGGALGETVPAPPNNKRQTRLGEGGPTMKRQKTDSGGEPGAPTAVES